MVDQDFQIVGLNIGVLRRAGEKIIRVLDDKLIQGTREATNTAQELPLRLPARPARCQLEAIVPGYPAMTATSSDPMSMPSSSALVATTPRIWPLRKPRSISRLSGEDTRRDSLSLFRPPGGCGFPASGR